MQRIALIFFLVAASSVPAVMQFSPAGCPTMIFTKPAGMLLPDSSEAFHVSVAPVRDPERLSYKWGTSSGKIVSGQGTSEIKVSIASEDRGKNLIVFVLVGGLPEGCPDTLSDTFAVADLIADEFPPTFGVVKSAIAYANVDSWLVTARFNPGFGRVAVMRFGPNEPDRSRLRRLRQILYMLELRKEVESVSFALVETPSRAETQLRFRAPGSDFKLEGESFVLLKATELRKNPKRILGQQVCNCYRKIT